MNRKILMEHHGGDGLRFYYEDGGHITPERVLELLNSPRPEADALLPGMREALLYFVGTRGAQAVYDNIKAAIKKMERDGPQQSPQEKT